MLHLLK